MIKYAVLGTVAAMALAGAANAEGFDGPYVGAGYDVLSGNLKVISSGPATLKLSTYNNALKKTNGNGFSADVGYNTQFMGMLVGVEANYSDAKGEKAFSSHPHTVDLTGEINHISDLRVRFGGDLADNLLYIFAGAAKADTSVTATSLAVKTPAAPARTDTVTGSHSGTVIGGGVSRKFGDRIAGVAELASYNLGTQSYDFPVASKFGTNQIALKATTVKVGLNLHFK